MHRANGVGHGFRPHCGLADVARDFLGGGPDEVPERYRTAQPALDPARSVLVHGSDDDTVPPSQSVDGARLSGAELILMDGVDHFDVIDPGSEIWARVVEVLDARLVR